ncbi:MAG TPA: hypothetical protein VHZ96_26450 [Frankiaceae bacterium]|jgi:hypothetical protein|nr:hypothetical protein [Frankiaceae bacterium]
MKIIDCEGRRVPGSGFPAADPVIYVDCDTGSDDNDGTRERPVRTVKAAANLLNADTIHVTGTLSEPLALPENVRSTILENVTWVTRADLWREL